MEDWPQVRAPFTDPILQFFVEIYNELLQMSLADSQPNLVIGELVERIQIRS